MDNKYSCTLSLKTDYFRAEVIPLGRGKFKIVNDESGKYKDKIIDASDVIHCNAEISLEQDINLENFCREILNAHRTIRFSCLANSLGSIVAAVYREEVIPLIPKQEFSQRSILSTIREDFESRMGVLEYVIGRYEKLVYGIVPISENREFYLVLSFDVNSNVESVIKNKVIPLVKKKDIC